MATQPLTSRPAAGIVAFGPDPARLAGLLDAIAEGVGRVFVFVNAVIDAAALDDLLRRDRVEIIRSDINLGVGAGLNALTAAAAAAGFSRMLLFDQDSRPSSALVDALERAMDRLTEQGRRPAAVGPRLIAPAAEPEFKAPRYPRRPGARRVPDLTAVDFIATSGSLVDLAAVEAIGPFRSDFFIDAIDLEWGFRAWDRGYSIWRVDDIAMEHTIGGGSIRFFGLVMPDQKPFRMHAYLRNNAYGFRLPHVPLRWKLRQAPYLALQALAYAVRHRFDGEVLRTLGAGVWRGFKGDLGPPPGAAFTAPVGGRSHPPVSDAGSGTGPSSG
jgi:rhamnosyltransferase